MSKPTYKLEYEWDDESGDYLYILLVRNDLFANASIPYLRWASGNKAWATRISRHYSIPLPKETK